MRWLAIVVVAGCARVALPIAPDARPASAPLATAFVVPGEAMEFKVSLRGIALGTVQIAVGRAGWVDGRPAVILRARGASGGLLAAFTQLTWELTTTLDTARGFPIRNVEDSTVTFNGKTEHGRHEDSYFVGDDRHDLHSVACALRGWRSHAGERATIQTKIGGARIDAVVWDAGREYLAAAHSHAVRYDGIARDEFPFAIWISDDGLRVPLAIRTETRWGRVDVQLVEYIPPPQD
ncbi:MAG: DUF3108 domain-containing protein [Kofleriaceae bacterium]